MSAEGKDGISKAERDEIEASKPEDTDFRQQRLRAWQPLLTPKWVISSFLIVGIIFLPIGIAILVTSGDIVEYEQRYDHLTCANGCYHDLEFKVEEDMKAPVFLYYKLTNFYQNHRRYVKSRADKQLAGEGGSTANCDPLEKYNGLTLYPCGLVANSHFTDTFNVSRRTASDSSFIDLSPSFDTHDIAWETDVDTKFKDLYPGALPSGLTRDGPNGRLPHIEDRHFIVWMRTAGLPTFKKLYGKITTDLKKGDTINVGIVSNFNVTSFEGTKSVVLSTANWLGGKNDFLGLAYIIVGALCILLGLGFLIKQIVSPRTLGDMKYFSWPTRKHDK